MNYILSIDSSQSDYVVITIRSGGIRYEKKVDSKEKRSQITLSVIESILQENNLTLKNITEIEMTTNSGSFTGLRVGATIGILLSLLLNIPINGKKPGTLPTLSYGKNLWGIS